MPERGNCDVWAGIQDGQQYIEAGLNLDTKKNRYYETGDRELQEREGRRVLSRHPLGMSWLVVVVVVVVVVIVVGLWQKC